MANLVTMAQATYNAFEVGTQGGSFNAKDLGISIILGMSGGKTAQKLMKWMFPCNSFSSGTLIHTEHGLVPIEEVKIGDLVYSYNENSGLTELKKVTHLIRGDGLYDLVSIYIDNGETIQSTLEHPFFIENQWVNAEGLRENAPLFGISEGFKVKSLDKLRSDQPVFNLTVEDNHTYFIGESGVLVHNAGKCKNKKRISENKVSANSFEEARNKALNLLGKIDETNRRNLAPCRLQDSVAKGMSTGFQTIVDGVWKEFRIDYDPKKGLHINVKVGKAAGMTVNTAISFPGKEKTLKKLIGCYN